jgi:hypothetical protein
MHLRQARVEVYGDMIFAGIDPGRKGAIAWMNSTRTKVEICDVPIRDGDYDIHAMANIIKLIAAEAQSLTPCGLCPGEVVLVMEWVHAMPRDGKCSAFDFGRGRGIWEGILGACGIVPVHADPAVWKRAMLAGLPKGKQSSVDQASRLFPAQAELFIGERGGLKDGRAEALLLAEYGRRKHRLGGR